MLLRKGVRNPRKIFFIGMLLFVVANLSRFLPRVVSMSEDRLAFVMGAFYGMAIGTMIVGLVLQKKLRQQH